MRASLLPTLSPDVASQTSERASALYFGRPPADAGNSGTYRPPVAQGPPGRGQAPIRVCAAGAVDNAVKPACGSAGELAVKLVTAMGLVDETADHG